MGGTPGCVVRVGERIPTDFARSLAGTEGDGVPRSRLSMPGSDWQRGEWGLVQVTRTFRGLSARLSRRGKVEYLGIFARVKGIASVGLTRFKTPILTKTGWNFI